MREKMRIFLVVLYVFTFQSGKEANPTTNFQTQGEANTTLSPEPGQGSSQDFAVEMFKGLLKDNVTVGNLEVTEQAMPAATLNQEEDTASSSVEDILLTSHGAILNTTQVKEVEDQNDIEPEVNPTDKETNIEQNISEPDMNATVIEIDDHSSTLMPANVEANVTESYVNEINAQQNISGSDLENIIGDQNGSFPMGNATENTGIKTNEDTKSSQDSLKRLQYTNNLIDSLLNHIATRNAASNNTWKNSKANQSAARAEHDASSSLQSLDRSSPSTPTKDDIAGKVLDVLHKQEIPTSLLEDGLGHLSGINPGSLPIEESEEYLKIKCQKNGNETSYENVMRAKDELAVCMTGLVDIREMQNEIEVAKPKGDLDEVFKKYCRRTPKLKSCVKNFTMALGECLDPEEQSTKQVIVNITEALTNFICFKEGDRIALFIAEGGPECLYGNIEPIMKCMNNTLFKYMPEDDSATEPPQGLFILEEKHCVDYTEVQNCVVESLESCQEPTPANIIDSMFKFIRKSTPCHTFDLANSSPQTIPMVSLFILTATALVLNGF